MAERFMPFLKEYWPILAVIGAGLLAWGGTQMRLQGIEQDINEIKAGAERETRQWQRISDNSGELASHEQRLKEIERHIDPDAVQQYGALKAVVAEDHRILLEHLREHD